MVISPTSGKAFDRQGNLIINGSYITQPLVIGWNKIEDLQAGNHTIDLIIQSCLSDCSALIIKEIDFISK